MSAKQYPVAYAKLMAKGFRWQRLRESSGQTVIVWRHVDSQQIKITLMMDGRVQEFEPVADGTLTIAKPQPGAFDAFKFAAEHGAEITWLEDGMDEDRLRVVAISGIDEQEERERLLEAYGRD